MLFFPLSSLNLFKTSKKKNTSADKKMNWNKTNTAWISWDFTEDFSEKQNLTVKHCVGSEIISHDQWNHGFCYFQQKTFKVAVCKFYNIFLYMLKLSCCDTKQVICVKIEHIHLLPLLSEEMHRSWSKTTSVLALSITLV